MISRKTPDLSSGDAERLTNVQPRSCGAGPRTQGASTRWPFLFPPALKPGDTVAVIAPSSPFEPVLAWVGMGWLAKRYRLRFDRALFTRRGYLAGTDERRREELARAMADPAVRAIIAVRGGYGASRMAHTLDWTSFARSPRWIVGFSDITVLHVHASRAGVASLHGSHVAELGRADERTRAALVHALEHPLDVRVFSNLFAYREGTGAGPLFGGNLAMLHDCAAAGQLSVPDACVLLLEEVTERPYRIDRMLTALIAGGHLSRAAAVVIGDFTQCNPGPDGVTVSEVLRERLGTLGVPVVAGVPIGHDLRNEPVVFGGYARVSADHAHATLLVGGEPPGEF